MARKKRKKELLSDKVSTYVYDDRDIAVIVGTINDIVIINSMMRTFEIADLEVPEKMLEKVREWIRE